MDNNIISCESTRINSHASTSAGIIWPEIVIAYFDLCPKSSPSHSKPRYFPKENIKYFWKHYSVAFATNNNVHTKWLLICPGNIWNCYPLFILYLAFWCHHMDQASCFMSLIHSIFFLWLRQISSESCLKQHPSSWIFSASHSSSSLSLSFQQNLRLKSFLFWLLQF